MKHHILLLALAAICLSCKHGSGGNNEFAEQYMNLIGRKLAKCQGSIFSHRRFKDRDIWTELKGAQF